jgi:two-component system cell cycle sensor histidine kinase/response regulator CckA
VSHTNDERRFPLPALSGSRALLVVDDERTIRHVTYSMLSDAGYRVFEAGSAAEALEVLRIARPPVELVIADVVMPDMNGVALVERIHRQWPETRILFMSAFPAEVLVQAGLERPNVHFLAKPFTRGELVGKVAEALASPAGDRRDAGSRDASGRDAGTPGPHAARRVERRRPDSPPE